MSSEADILDPGQRGLNGLYNNHKVCITDLERESFNSVINEHDEPELKQETSEFPIAKPCESHVESLLISSGDISVSIKDKLVDDYDSVPNAIMETIQLKPEDINKEAEDFSFCDDGPILEKQLKKHSIIGKYHKESHNSPLGVAKTRMLKLGNRTMSTASIEACEITKNMVKISALQAILSSCRTDKSLLKHSENSFPAGFENTASPIKVVGTKIKNLFSGNNGEQKRCLVKGVSWEKIQMHNSHSITLSSAAAEFIVGEKRPDTAKTPVLRTAVDSNPSTVLSGLCRRRRPQKLKLSAVKQPLKYIRKTITENHCASLRPCSDHPESMLDLEDVDGVLFVSFESKEGLNNHTIDPSGRTGEPLNEQTALQITCDSGCQERLSLLEIKLLEDLKSFRHKQVIHPSLQEVGLKLGSVDPTASIDLKYLGVQLPLSSSKDRVFGNKQGTRHSSLDTTLSFISRTGKTDDFRKIKGWQEKFHSPSGHEGSILQGSLKNRSAFCSDTLDEYLENEGKLIQTSMGFPPNFSSCPVVHQFSVENSNYVQGQHSILEEKWTPPASYSFNPLPSLIKRRRYSKKASSRGSIKCNSSAVGSLALSKEQYHAQTLEDEVTTSQPNSQTDNTVNVLMIPDLDENIQGKQRTVCQSTYNSHICMTHTKLMALEGCALQNGKPRTYVTEERADFSLRTLFISQFPEQKSASGSLIQDTASLKKENMTEKVEFGAVHLEEMKSYIQDTETLELQITMLDSKPEELFITQPQFHVEGIMSDGDAVTSGVAGNNTEVVKQLLSALPASQIETVFLDHSYFFKGAADMQQNVKLSEDTSDDIFQLDNSESSEGNKNVDIKSVEKEFLKETNISDIKTTTTHALPPRQLNFVHGDSDKVNTPSPKRSELRNIMLKDVARAVTKYRANHTEQERCRRKEMKELFEKLQATLQFPRLPRVAKRILLEKAREEIQGLINEADKLVGQKKLLLRKQDILIRKVSALSGKTREVVLKKLQYISLKQKAIEALKQQQEQKKQPVEAVEAAETARPCVQDGPRFEMKEVILSQIPEKSMTPRMTGSHATENEDLFLMPRIVNVMSLATEEDTDLNLDINENPYASLVIDSLSSKPFLPVVSQEEKNQYVEKADSFCERERDATCRTQNFTGKKEIRFSQMGNDSSLKKSLESFATKLCIEELAQSQMEEKQNGSGGRHQSKDSCFQELQVKEPKAVGKEMELQKVAFAVQEPAPDANSLMDMNDNTDETLTSILNEIEFLNQQLNDGASDVSEIPNSLSSYSSPGGMESPRESAAADGSPFQFGPLGGSFKNLCLVQESTGSITPLLLHLGDDNIADHDKTLGQPSSKPGDLKLMLGSEVKDPNLDFSVNIDESGKHMVILSNTTHVSPPILKMKTNLGPGKVDTIWKPMPKLAPFGLKPANFPLDSGGTDYQDDVFIGTH